MSSNRSPTPPFPKQKQAPPGSEKEMRPKPIAVDHTRFPSRKLHDKVAIITGGDSGIGRAVAVLCAQEGADVVVVYLNEHDDAAETKNLIEQTGRQSLFIAGDLGDENFCRDVVEQTMRKFGRIDILINNAAEQHPQKNLEDITKEQLEKTFHTNIFAYFFLTKHTVPHLKPGSAIINTTSVTAYRGSPQLLDYSATKGAIVAFTRSLSQALVPRGIRVNAVAPGPVWTPLIVSTFPPEKSSEFGKDVPMGRPGQPEEIAPSYIFFSIR